MSVALVSPTYGPVEPKASKSLRAAIMHASNQGVRWCGEASADRMKFDASRNIAVESVINDDKCTGILWSDSDIVWPVDGISRLILSGLDFICGIYYQRGSPYWPLIAHYSEKREAFNWWVSWPEKVVAPIDGCGFGCVYTSIEIFRKLDPPWFSFTRFSEDFDFCLRAAGAGFQLHVDTGVECGHLSEPEVITSEHFRQAKPELEVSDGLLKRPQAGDLAVQAGRL